MLSRECDHGGDGPGPGHERHGEGNDDRVVSVRLGLVVMLHPSRRTAQHFQSHEHNHEPARRPKSRQRNTENTKNQLPTKAGDRENQKRTKGGPDSRSPPLPAALIGREPDENRRGSNRIGDGEDGGESLEEVEQSHRYLGTREDRTSVIYTKHNHLSTLILPLGISYRRRATGASFCILDQPTTRLHFDDIKKLLAVLHAQVERGNICRRRHPALVIPGPKMG